MIYLTLWSWDASISQQILPMKQPVRLCLPIVPIVLLHCMGFVKPLSRIDGQERLRLGQIQGHWKCFLLKRSRGWLITKSTRPALDMVIPRPMNNIAADFAVACGRKASSDKPLSNSWFMVFLARWDNLKVAKPQKLSLVRASYKCI